MVSTGNITGLSGGLGLGLEGLGLLGGIETGEQEAQLAGQASQVEQQMAGYEQQINSWRQQQMNLFGQRQQMENYRNTQKARTMGMASAVNSGAQYGSGIAGGQSAAAAEGGQNTRNLSQNLQIGNTIFGLTGQIDTSKMQLAGIEGQINTLSGQGSIFQGLGSLGGGLMQAAPNLGMMLGV